jgi:flagellar hook-associated protein 3 FlgL
MINTTNEITFRLSNLNAEQTKISYQMSTGLEINKGSEDSVLYTEQLQIESKILKYEGIQSQLNKVNALNTASDTTISEIKNLLDYTKSEMIKAANATTDENAKAGIAIALEGVKQNLLMFANEEIDGQYLFAGSDATVKPFEDDGTGKIVYNGDTQLRKVTIEDGLYRDRGVNGFDMMMYSTDVATKNDPTLSFIEDQRIIDQDNFEWKLDAGQTNLVKYDLNGNATSDTKTVTSDGATPPTFSVNIGTSDGQKFAAKSSIFDELDKVINALNLVDSSGNPISNTESSTEISSLLDNMGAAFDAVNIAHAELGGRNRIFEDASDRIGSKITQYNIFFQEIAAADLTEVAVKSKALELTYTALYSTINRTNELSLVNFI